MSHARTENSALQEILNKLSVIETCVARIDTRLDNLDRLVTDNSEKLKLVESSLQFQSDTIDEHRKEIDSLKCKMTSQQKSIDFFKKIAR